MSTTILRRNVYRRVLRHNESPTIFFFSLDFCNFLIVFVSKSNRLLRLVQYFRILVLVLIMKSLIHHISLENELITFF